MAVRPMKVWNAATSTWDDVAVSQRGDVVNKTDFAAKGDIIAGTGTSAYDNVTAGSNGQMLMADSSATAGLRYVDPPANRNLIINGAMQVAQRNTSVASITTDGYYTADRWVTVLSSLGTWTQSVESDAPTGSGFRKSLKMLCTTADASPAAGDYMYLGQRLEGQDLQRIKKGTASAEQLTLSFWVKSNVTGTFSLNLLDTDNSNRLASAQYSVSASATWERKTITFTADSTGALNDDNGTSLIVAFGLGAGTTYTSGTTQSWGSFSNGNWFPGQTNLAAATNNYWQVTGVQLETGTGTPFEFEPYEATLRKCQRYYYKVTAASGKPFGVGQVYASTNAIIVVPFAVPMRANPSALEQSGTASHYYVTTSNYTSTANSQVPSFNQASSEMAEVATTVASGLTAGNATVMRSNDASAYLAWSAEL